MKTDNITNLVFSEIDIKEDNLNKNNFTIYSLDILSEESDENSNNKTDSNDSLSEDSIDLDNYNLDIKTSNHSNKIDSPSGTSLDLISSLDKENISIDSIRSDEYMAEQIVSFKNKYEELNIEHIVTDRNAYLTGINLVLESLSSMKGYYFGLEKILKNKI